jgi:hypothetical protein
MPGLAGKAISGSGKLAAGIAGVGAIHRNVDALTKSSSKMTPLKQLMGYGLHSQRDILPELIGKEYFMATQPKSKKNKERKK